MSSPATLVVAANQISSVMISLKQRCPIVNDRFFIDSYVPFLYFYGISVEYSLVAKKESLIPNSQYKR